MPSDRLAGRNTAAERFLRRLRQGRREARLWFAGLPISTTVGGWVWRGKAAGSGRAASTVMCVSGRLLRG